MKALVADKLREYKFESYWLDIICGTITTVLNAPLDPGSEDLKFSCIQNRDRLNELEFYFPLKSISPEKLERLFQANMGHQPVYGGSSSTHAPGLGIPGGPPETIERLQFSPTRGFMKGFMDLVFQWRDRFYLVDWKSNFLGSRIEDYDQTLLTMAMKKELYILQYTIYTLALDQYLRLRMPGYRYEKHFGGVYYIFLRGVDSKMGPDFGIYRDVPLPELIGALREGLIEK
jgi:exodeoxyribonuclease V beta subunit